jgi:alpha-1,6-mannosyltransferase
MKALLFCTAALGQAGCYLGLLLLGNLRQNVLKMLCFFAGAFLLYIFTLRLLLCNESLKRDGLAARQSFLRRNGYLMAVLGLAVLFRLILWPGIPSLSDDIYRYVWEGRVVASGHNPFALAPNAPRLAQLRDAAIFPLISRPNLTTIYPPLAQFIFAAASAVSYSVASMKAVFILFDLATLAVLLKILAALGKNPLQSAIYALNPLVIVEFSGSGHLDSAGTFFMMLALYLFVKQKHLWSGAALALAFMVKLLPVLLIPVILRKRKLAALALFSVISAAAFLPFIDAGRQLYASLGIYMEHWMFNGSFYNLLIYFIPDNQTARRIAAALFCLAAAGAYYRFLKQDRSLQAENIFRQCLFLLGLFILFTPIVHPWYVCWLVPLVAVVPNRAWLLFSGLVFASYWVLRIYAETGLWKETTSILLIEYVPLYGLLLFDYVRAKKKVAHENYL